MVVVLALFLFAACGGSGGPDSSSAPQPAVAHRRLNVGGVDRTYRLYTPPDSQDAGPVPLVLALHGSGNTADSLVDSSEFDDAADAGGFIVAYPQAVGISWNAGFCCTTGRGDPAADIRFLDALVTDVVASRRIDERRIYAVGFSAGGMMAYRLACDLAGRFAGVGVIAASMVLDDCRPSRPVSVIAIHGTADDVVPYAGGRIDGGATKPAPPAPAVAERWATLDACPDASPARRAGAGLDRHVERLRGRDERQAGHRRGRRPQLVPPGLRTAERCAARHHHHHRVLRAPAPLASTARRSPFRLQLPAYWRLTAASSRALARLGQRAAARRRPLSRLRSPAG